MQWADRVAAGADLERRIEREIALLSADHPAGFAVRLHVLGNFYSHDYLELWDRMLEQHPALHVFGYTARWDFKNDPIAVALAALVQRHWDRFAIRFSNAPFPFEAPTTVTVEHPFQGPDDAILCREQTGRTESCSTCGLCWQTKRRMLSCSIRGEGVTSRFLEIYRND